MKHTTILILILIAISASGQQKDSSLSEFTRVQIGFNISPDICSRTLKNNDGSALSDIIIKQNNENETAKLGYTIGLNVCYNLKRFVGIEAGIQFSNKGYRTKKMDIDWDGYSPNLPTKLKLVFNFHYIDIPLKVNFTFGKKRIRLFTSIGVTTNIYMEETQTNVFIYSDHRQRETKSTTFVYRKINFSPTVSFGFDYKINRRMNLRVEPTFRYGVLKIIDTPVTGYLYNCGLNISLFWYLKQVNKSKPENVSPLPPQAPNSFK